MSGHLWWRLVLDLQIHRVARQLQQPLYNEDNQKALGTKIFKQQVSRRIELLNNRIRRERGNHTSHFVERAASFRHARRDSLCEVVDLGASAGEVADGTAIVRNTVDDTIEGARGEFVDEAGDVWGGGS